MDARKNALGHDAKAVNINALHFER